MPDNRPSDPLGLIDRPTLVVSPHLDDAWLSAASILVSRKCEVWTVFAGTPDPAQSTDWDRRCGFADSEETMRARVAEDTSAFADTDHLVDRLPYLDGAYADPHRRRRDLADFRAQLQTWLNEHPAAVVVLPVCAGAGMKPAPWDGIVRKLRRPGTCGGGSADQPRDEEAQATESGRHELGLRARFGGPVAQVVGSVMHADYQRRRRAAQRSGMAVNPDHAAVRDTALDICRDFPEVTTVFFEDLPYLWSRRGHDSAAALSRHLSTPLRILEAPIDRDVKFAHVSRYASQLLVLDPVHQRLSVPDRLPETETYWIARGGDAA